MKSFLTILALGALGLGVWLFLDNRAEAKKAAMRARIEARQKAEEEQRQAEEESRIRAEALAKEEAVRLLNRFIAAKEKLIKQENEEKKAEYESIELDAQSLSDELSAIDKIVERKASAAEKMGQMPREKLAHVEAMLESKVLARLASIYLGEDFVAQRLQFKSRVKQWIRIEEETAYQLAKNREKYNKGIAELDDDVEEKVKIARTRLEASSAAIGQRAELYKTRLEDAKQRKEALKEKERQMRELGKMRRKRDRLLVHGMLSPWGRQELRDLEVHIALEEEKIARQNEIYALAQANLAHLEATAAEVRARRRGDKLTAEKAEADDAVRANEQREMDYFLFAQQMEDNTLGRLRDAIYKHKCSVSGQLAANERRLEMLSSAVPNMDLLTTEQIQSLRQELAENLKKDIIFDLIEDK